jgi:RNA polymerase-binding transcription factor DksA
MIASSNANPWVPDGPRALSSAQLAALRHLLEADRGTVLARARVFVDENGQIDSTSATRGQGETEHTAIDIERRVSGLLELQARDTLVEIDAALLRMHNGTYGRCESCGSVIPGERLVAIPEARYCIDCQGRPGTGT